jgi:hypothetical protein
MRKFITGLLAAVLMTVGAVSVASPAQAAYGGTTAWNSFSLYQWTGLGAQYEGDRWQTSYQNVINNGGCLNVSGSWINGTAKNNNTASFMFRTSGSAYAGYTLRVYDWPNCNDNGFSRYISYLGGDGYQNITSNLNDWWYNDPYSGSIKLNRTISSIKIRNPLDE